MHLSNRGCGDRLAVEMDKEVVNGTPQALFNLLNRDIRREGSDIFLKRSQRCGVLIGQNIAAHAQCLTKFDEGRSEPREREAEPLR